MGGRIAGFWARHMDLLAAIASAVVVLVFLASFPIAFGVVGTRGDNRSLTSLAPLLSPLAVIDVVSVGFLLAAARLAHHPVPLERPARWCLAAIGVSALGLPIYLAVIAAT